MKFFSIPVILALLSATSFLRAGDDVNPRQVREMIDKGKRFLYKTQQPDGSWRPSGKSHYPMGNTVMACYALLASGDSVRSDRLSRALDRLAKHKTDYVYPQGILCNVWKLAARQNRRKYAPLLTKASRYRSASRRAVGETTAPKLESLKVSDRDAVILSWQDITSGLVGYPSGTARGYECDSAFKLMRSIVLSAK